MDERGGDDVPSDFVVWLSPMTPTEMLDMMNTRELAAGLPLSTLRDCEAYLRQHPPLLLSRRVPRATIAPELLYADGPYRTDVTP